MTFKYLRNFDIWLRRHGVHISLTIIVVAFSTILLLLASSLSQQAEQSAQQKQILTEIKSITEQLNRNAKTQTEQINGIDRHLDCIVAFFALSDRATRSITDIDTCRTRSNETGEVSVPKTSTKTNTDGQPTENDNPPVRPPAPEEETPPQQNPSIIEVLLSPINNLLMRL